MAKPQQVPLVPLSTKVFDGLRNREDVQVKAGDMPVLGNDFNEPDVAYAYTGFCDKFDLNNPDDRNSYAELTSKLYAGTEYMRLWEERIPADGNIVVFISYIRVMKVLQDGNKIDLNSNVR